MESKKAKPVKKQKNIGNDSNELNMEPVKIYKKCYADFKSAKDANDYMNIIKKLEDLRNKKSDYTDAISLMGR